MRLIHAGPSPFFVSGNPPGFIMGVPNSRNGTDQSKRKLPFLSIFTLEKGQKPVLSTGKTRELIEPLIRTSGSACSAATWPVISGWSSPRSRRTACFGSSLGCFTEIHQYQLRVLCYSAPSAEEMSRLSSGSGTSGLTSFLSRHYPVQFRG